MAVARFNKTPAPKKRLMSHDAGKQSDQHRSHDQTGLSGRIGGSMYHEISSRAFRALFNASALFAFLAARFASCS